MGLKFFCVCFLGLQMGGRISSVNAKDAKNVTATAMKDFVDNLQKVALVALNATNETLIFPRVASLRESLPKLMGSVVQVNANVSKVANMTDFAPLHSFTATYFSELDNIIDAGVQELVRNGVFTDWDQTVGDQTSLLKRTLRGVLKPSTSNVSSSTTGFLQRECVGKDPSLVLQYVWNRVADGCVGSDNATVTDPECAMVDFSNETLAEKICDRCVLERLSRKNDYKSDTILQGLSMLVAIITQQTLMTTVCPWGNYSAAYEGRFIDLANDLTTYIEIGLTTVAGMYFPDKLQELTKDGMNGTQIRDKLDEDYRDWTHGLFSWNRTRGAVQYLVNRNGTHVDCEKIWGPRHGTVPLLWIGNTTYFVYRTPSNADCRKNITKSVDTWKKEVSKKVGLKEDDFEGALRKLVDTTKGFNAIDFGMQFQNSSYPLFNVTTVTGGPTAIIVLNCPNGASCPVEEDASPDTFERHSLAIDSPENKTLWQFYLAY